jgi:PBP1b-binding outer membrane lipoprotein LpoB
MKVLASLLILIPVLSGCISSSSPPAPAKSTTVIVPADSKTTVICQDGTNPPC